MKAVSYEFYLFKILMEEKSENFIKFYVEHLITYVLAYIRYE